MILGNETIYHGIQVRKKIMDFITRYIIQHGYSPTVKEIGDGVGLKSTSSVHSHVKQLIKEGKLETDDPGFPRALRVPGYRYIKEDEVLNGRE